MGQQIGITEDSSVTPTPILTFSQKFQAPLSSPVPNSASVSLKSKKMLFRNIYFAILIGFLLGGFFITPSALADIEPLCNLDTDFCKTSGQTRSVSAAPSSSARINLNPSAVPTQKSFGIEVIGYKGEADLGIVRGFGRMGAALTPSNSEETFFGAPGFEYESAFLDRKIRAEKYRQQKYTLATAFNLYEKGRGLRQISFNLGLLGKYNSLTKAANPGGGLSGILGPFIVGYSVYRDETLLDPEDSTNPDQKIQSIVETYSIGLYLTNLILDHSTLRVQNNDPMWIDLTTLSLFIKKIILTASQRQEHSNRASYNDRNQSLEYVPRKIDYFYGAQFRVTPNFMIGALYNYYLLREASVSATLMF